MLLKISKIISRVGNVKLKLLHKPLKIRLYLVLLAHPSS